MRPASLVLGNSRAEIGFDPESPAWPESARPVFNLALPGAGIAAVADELAEALRSTSPRLVVVGLDFLDFRVDPSSDESFTAQPANADPLREMARPCRRAAYPERARRFTGHDQGAARALCS